MSAALSLRDGFLEFATLTRRGLLFSGSGGIGYAESDVLPARGGRFWRWCVKIAPVVRGTFLGVVAGMRRSFGGNGVLRMSFSGFFGGICEVRATSGVGRISELRGPVRVSCVLHFGAARIVKNAVS